MKLEKYDPQKYREHIPKWFSMFSCEPSGDTNRYFEVIEEGIEAAAEIFGVPTDFKIVLAMTDEEALDEAEGRVDRYDYFQAFSFSPFHEGFDDWTMLFRASDSFENWEDALRRTAVHESAHQKFWRECNMWGPEVYVQIVFEGHAMVMAERVSREEGYQWKPVWKTVDIEAESERIEEELDRKRSWDNETGEEESSLFVLEGEEWPRMEGYVISYRVVRDIMERNDWGLDRLPKMADEEMREEVGKSVKRVYGGN